LDKFVETNPAQKGKVSKGTRATTVEAIIGAVWVDSGKNASQVNRVMENMGL
jgi:ribonuclease-3